LDGTLTVPSGTLTLSAGVNVAGAVDLIGGSLAPGASSTFTFDGTGTRALSHDANDSFHDVVVDLGGAFDLDVTDSGLQVAGDLTVTAGRLDLAGLGNGEPTSVTGAVSVSGTVLSGTNNFTAGSGLTVESG